MARLTAFSPLDMLNTAALGGTITRRDAKAFEVQNALITTRYEGDFSYDTALRPVGAATSATLLVSDTPVMKITEISIESGVIAAAITMNRPASILYLALQGDDVIVGSSGNDTLIGLAGNDRISGKDGSDQLFGLEGDDVLDGGNGNDVLIGGTGRNALYGGEGFDLAVYSDDTPVIVSLAEAGYQNTGTSIDRLTGIEGIVGSEGNDTLTGDSNVNLLAGAGGNDRLTGGAGNDTLLGGIGRDTVAGGNGNDLIEGGAGSDRLTGGSGNDTLQGGDGHDYLIGGTGKDRLDGGAGNDTLIGGSGDDQLFGGNGIDTVLFQGSDSFYIDLGAQLQVQTGQGLDSFDSVENATTGAGHDRLHGSGLANRLIGSAGHDSLVGLGGDDRLDGGSGRDWLLGGAGADRLTGGTGRDTFAFHFTADSPVGRGRDVITDFATGEDRLDLSQIDANPDQGGDQAFIRADRATAHGVWTVKSGTDLLLRADTTGDGITDLAIQLANVAQIEAGDLIL
ncbi:MAG: calcium-binding protein [Paracoccus sp. (in: a-proteobacteria)]|uniref:calcium-binding protein n=1 Tax=Paracoccus sp. TaxID=267 RepID=UPI0026DF2A03|nr:calcium-binding protein [Paracoccus sp. (in: a-proteobacteria)]MDO5630395.1 calcium-binding protein [Paracoccus sp. (in: a-proteobacteria)]